MELSSVPAQRISGRYEIIRVLGEGASARTLLCLDLREQRQVAVKELRFVHVRDWKHIELFEAEARILSMLDHTGIPRVFDFFNATGESGSLYIVQELIEGTSLEQRMRSGPMLSQQELHDTTLGLLDTLEYLHERLPPVLHRDIKPSNIIMRKQGGPALIDFGSVCFGWRPPDSGGTTVIGTFGYMPPEQLVGQARATSDLYALGATLLHVVTGRPPGGFPFDSGRIEVPTDLPVKEPLARLIEALLRPAPRDRPQTADAARRILLGSHQMSSAVTTTSGARPVIRAKRTVTVSSGDGPRFVDMGAPPRDPAGEFSDVYRNLMHPLFPARKLWSPVAHVFWVGFSSVVSVITLGVVPAIYAYGLSRRRQKYDALFRYGAHTTGTIRSVGKQGVPYVTFRFEFEVGDTSYLAFMDCAGEMENYWAQGDTVPVLYDPEDPSISCFVYR
jgi:serine/threonine protein kinase